MTRFGKNCIIENGVTKARNSARSGHIFAVRNLTPYGIYAMRSQSFWISGIRAFLLSCAGLAGSVVAQTTEDRILFDATRSSNRWYLNLAVLVGAILVAVVYLWRRGGTVSTKYHYQGANNRQSNGTHYIDNFDAELDWLRKSKKARVAPATPKITYDPNKPTIAKIDLTAPKSGVGSTNMNFDTAAFQAKMRKMQYGQLPINSFDTLTPSQRFDQLQLCNDEGLISAIDQANEEFEEDEAVRDLAVRILAAFRMRNSVEALSQIALYDLSANLRSKAVSTLTDFDHESVFEAILLACADPTREVRAAAARGLFRLNFDRADAWKRIIETGDEYRMSHAARAAIEAGIVNKSFDRLINEDTKVAYEAFALVTLLIRAGETREIFKAISTHKDERVRLALLHVLKVTRDERTLPELQRLMSDSNCPTDVTDRIRETIKYFEAVSAEAACAAL